MFAPVTGERQGIERMVGLKLDRWAVGLEKHRPLAIRPLQVNPSWQFLAMEGGSAEVLSIAAEKPSRSCSF